jgi:AcrR family transcriptional regulator
MTRLAEDPGPALPRDVRGLPQRERLLWSMVRMVAEKGYERVTIADVVAYAGVSRSSFYAEWDNKDECVFDAYDRVVEALVGYVADAFASATAWADQIRLGLDALLRAFAAEPAVARMATVEVPSAGPEAQRRYREAMESFLPFFRLGRTYPERGKELPEGVELMAVGGVEAIIFDEVVAGRVEGLPAMLPEILFAVLVPYIGPEAAVTEMHAVSAASGPQRPPL